MSLPEDANDAGMGAPESAVALDDYSAALDEIYRLRRALAYEASAIDAHLGYATFPKSRRQIAEAQMERMRRAARGQSERAYAAVSNASLRSGMREAEAPEGLTRDQWERECLGVSQ